MSTSKKEMEDLFEKNLYLYFHEDFLTRERTAKECTFVITNCNLQPGKQVLDLACGHGRHSNYLARLGFEVSGVDINDGFIQIAKKQAKLEGLSVDYILEDLLKIEFEDQFEAAFCLYNTLGFFDKKDASLFLNKAHQALRPNGRLVIDTKNRDHIIKELRPCSISEKNKDLMIDRVSFDPTTGITTNKRIYIKDGKRVDTPFSMNTYNFNELEEMIAQSQFKLVNVFGDWDENPLSIDSRRIILVLEK